VTDEFAILSPLSVPEAERLLRELARRVDAYLDARPDREEGLLLPTVTSASSWWEGFDEPAAARLPREVALRASGARSALVFDWGVDFNESPDQAALIAWLLARAGAGAVDWGGQEIAGETGATAEAAQRVFARLGAAGGLGAREAPDEEAAAAPVARALPAGPGAEGAREIVSRLEAAQADAAKTAAIRQAVARLGADERRYLELIIRNGPLGHAEAAERLGLAPDITAALARMLLERVRALTQG
jgi:hypothetical protein